LKIADHQALLGRAEARGDELCRDEVIELLGSGGPPDEELAAAADRVRERYCGPAVHLRALVEFTSHCRRSCAYCGLRALNQTLARYRMPWNQVLSTALEAAAMGVGTIVLQGGEDPDLDCEALGEVVCEIKKRSGVAVTLSVGERPFRIYEYWRKIGADRYLIKHETANPRLYRELHPDSDLNSRLKAIGNLRALGYQVGVGPMVGLPGQTLEVLADDILLARDLAADMVGIGPFIPHPETPLAGTPAGDPRLCLRVLAITRLVTRDAHLPATTAIATMLPDGHRQALLAGANVVMPDFTPAPYRERYQIYPGRRCADEKGPHCRDCLESMILGMGRISGKGAGHSLKPPGAMPERAQVGSDDAGSCGSNSINPARPERKAN